MNIYHRYIDLPFVYQKPKIFTETSNTFINYVNHKHIKKELLDWIDSYNLKFSNIVESFYTSKKNKIFVPIHNDMTVKPGVKDSVKLNFTWGPESSKTRWWKIKDENKLIEVQHDTNEINKGFELAGIIPDIECNKCYTANESDVELVYEKTINKPSLLNVGQLHSTFNPDTLQDRWTLSFVILKKDNTHLTFKESLEIFKKNSYE
jgi:hypothetical protein